MPMVFLVLVLSLIIYAVTVTFAAVTLLLLLLPNYCCQHITVTSNKFCQASIYPGVAELTTQLLRLISILWLPLCRINKFWLKYFPCRLLRTPTLVGHQDYFLAPLPGSIALFISSSGSYLVCCNLLSIMGKTKDSKHVILPSKTRRGTVLNTSIALDSPTVLNRFATPPHQSTTIASSVGSAFASDEYDDACTV